ncbi:exonuclease SbcCD subunit D [Lacisediminihabitans changchengi]|uniref:Nuclease SbcCD subunit D n=1 Tax=Lacisediminihabitans changchengi TaxID=2787634 RepID=A0A934SJQ0_9MICO|nr:exonuclease SbcCD subunit D [Lacisediminihabitans changchengi]MBK4346930.1 exonuclease SbcCD subunit D [Lacisediminihabitans changchengi]MBK4347947.1 exonuclease SbcCD subunit D [Lacisediminihabitans changchengi]
MKILHSSDWHIGRTFHGNSTIAHLGQVLEALVDVVRREQIDVVVVAGDIFDSATPAAESYELLTATLRGIRDAGAQVVLTSGNHDSATRLGFNAGFTGLAGIHIITRQELHDRPISIDDEFGPVHFYGIPYLEPSIVRSAYPGVELRSHEQMLGFAMERVRADLDRRGGRSVVLSHAFIADVPASVGLERDITAGGLDVVPLSTFDGPDYVALGHIHGRARLSERARYSGAPLHYSFSEVGKPRGAWLVHLDADGLDHVDWVDLPVPRELAVLTGDLDDLVIDPALAAHEDQWVSAVLTDVVRPMDAMRRLQKRFPYAAHLEFRPSVVAETTSQSYGQRIAAKSDHEIVQGFLELVRNGVGASEAERRIIDRAIEQRHAQVVETGSVDFDGVGAREVGA